MLIIMGGFVGCGIHFCLIVGGGCGVLVVITGGCMVEWYSTNKGVSGGNGVKVTFFVSFKESDKNCHFLDY